MRFINIFIGSSMIDLEMERAKLMSFIQGLNNKYAERGVFIRGYICEETTAAMSVEGSQKRHNDFIENNADAAVFMFFHRAGEFTLEELKLAREAFLKQKKPAVFVFFKAVDSAPDLSEEIQKCVGLVAGEYGHYYKVFDDIDTVKLELLQFLTDALPGKKELAIKDGVVWMNGEAIEGISSANVFAYQNNPDLKRLQSKAAGLEKLMKAASEKGDKSAVLRVSVQLEEVRKEYRELEKAILDALVFFHQQNRKGVKADALLQEALTQLELGDIDAAKALIPQEELDQMAERARKRRELAEEQLRGEETKLLEYSRARVKILLADVTNPERFRDVEKAYENALEAAKAQRDYGFIYDFAHFYYDQKSLSKGIDLAEKLRHMYDDPDVKDRIGDRDRANLLNLLGILYRDNNELDKAEPFSSESLELKRRICLQEPSPENESEVAKACNNLAIFYHITRRLAEAEKLYLEAITVFRRLAEEVSSASYRPALGYLCNNLGILYRSTDRMNEAERLFLEGLDLFRRLAEEVGRQVYEADVGDLCNSIAELYYITGRETEGERMYLEALEIRRRYAAEVNCEAFEPSVADTCSNLAYHYFESGRKAEAEKLFEEALEIRRRLVEEVSRKAYEPKLARIGRRLARIYFETSRRGEAEKLLRESLEIYRRFVSEVSPETYEPELAVVLYYLGDLYDSVQDPAQRDGYYAEAKELAKKYMDDDDECKEIYETLSKRL